MRKLLPAIYKELLLLTRDLPGLAILFIMPVALIMIVAIAQKNAIQASGENKKEILVIDEASTALSTTIIRNLEESSFFSVTDSMDGQKLDIQRARELISKGEYQLGIQFSARDSSIVLILDPTLLPSYKTTLVSSVNFVIKSTQSKSAIQGLIMNLAGSNSKAVELLFADALKNIAPVKETFAVKDLSTIKPGLMQNDIPGFILFAIFFIVLPLSGNMISEKSEGSFLRLRTTPAPIRVLLGAKVAVYSAVGLIQFALMLFVGTYILPEFFGLPQVDPGNQTIALIITSISSTLAAIGLGLLIGSIFTTQGQAASFGSTLVVILGVISGTFLPVYLMPRLVQKISLVSPIRWGIESYLDLFYRQGSLLSILHYILLLLLFFGFAMIISIVIFVRKN
jgi:ABC-2 type transport system permease protein